VETLANKFAFTAVLFFILSAFCVGLWGKEGEPVKNNDAELFPEGIIRVRGRVRLVGNMPMPRLVISDSDDRDWYVEDTDRNCIAGYEQQTITVEGRAEYHDIILANGKKIGVRRFLRDITVIEPQEAGS
jgi:hypothetical protein